MKLCSRGFTLILIISSFTRVIYSFSANSTHYHGRYGNKTTNLLGGIQEELQLLKEVVQTLVPLVNVVHKKVDTNTNNIQTLTDNAASYSKKVDSVTQTVNSVSSKIDSVTTIISSVSSNVKTNSKSIQSHDLKINSNTKKLDSTITKVGTIRKNTNSNLKSIEALSEDVSPWMDECHSLPSNICSTCKCRDDKRLPKKYYCDCTHLPTKRDCKQFHQEGFKLDGVYKIHQNNIRIIKVFCDQTNDGGGWSVFQRRLDGSVKFYRDWSTYKAGFGDLQHEFWLGNTNLFTLTLQGLYPSGNELRIELTDWDGVQKIAKYGLFEIANEDRKFQMTLSSYSGTAGDSFSIHNGMKFSTFDRDNDKHAPANCAVMWMGGWWYNACHLANLNGVYYDFSYWQTGKSICWRDFHGHSYSLKHVEMKVRRKD